jgi:hypothetical protein
VPYQALVNVKSLVRSQLPLCQLCKEHHTIRAAQQLLMHSFVKWLSCCR